MKHILIGISGKKFTGKSTVAEILQERHMFVVRALADPLKEALMSCMALTHEEVYNPELKEKVHPHWKTTPRLLMQLFGTELMQYDLPSRLREAGADPWWERNIWVETFKIWYKKFISEKKESRIVVPDIRFPHEMKALEEFGAIFWRVERDAVQGGIGTQHASESEIDKVLESFNHTIHNNSNKIELADKVSMSFDNLIRKSNEQSS